MLRYTGAPFPSVQNHDACQCCDALFRGNSKHAETCGMCDAPRLRAGRCHKSRHYHCFLLRRFIHSIFSTLALAKKMRRPLASADGYIRDSTTASVTLIYAEVTYGC